MQAPARSLYMHLVRYCAMCRSHLCQLRRLLAAAQAAAGASPRSQSVDGSAQASGGLMLGSVKKDAVTGDHVAVAGLLSLADQGVCCIQHLEKLAPHHAVRPHLVLVS